MKAKLLLSLALALGMTGVARAREEPSRFNSTAPPRAQTQWNTDPKYWARVLREPKALPDLKLGKRGYTVSGPLLDGLRRRHSSPDLRLGNRILRLPIIRMFVPGSPDMPPEGGGKYFRWGKSDRPWSAIAADGAAGSRDNAVTHEARSLISVSR